MACLLFLLLCTLLHLLLFLLQSALQIDLHAIKCNHTQLGNTAAKASQQAQAADSRAAYHCQIISLDFNFLGKNFPKPWNAKNSAKSISPLLLVRLELLCGQIGLRKNFNPNPTCRFYQSLMPKNHRKVAAAHARAARWSAPTAPTAEHSNSTLQATPAQTYSELQEQTSEPSKLCGREVNLIELDSEYECGYTGGVSCYWSDTGDEYETDSNADSERSECDSLCELEGSELEENLRELREEVIALGTSVDTAKHQEIMACLADRQYGPFRLRVIFLGIDKATYTINPTISSIKANRHEYKDNDSDSDDVEIIEVHVVKHPHST
ncbi:uncharacterized protein F5891DRAFT_984034 [Suillus fuscotomentosus]|uniref:Uncharacterized protein n=1 Tax=Suillus fuscotomentosus TaxID=1912939 RepID=A0AAD4DXK2_9AGAM|nr:uncharacterized protein F5891DRAFT_984034 [Suillus fuscotomentosus]KAG1895730.1 hypothetical protein F5891DRAFT_984034 [Suillus fuscotomentosus]